MSENSRIEWTDTTVVHSMNGTNARWGDKDCRKEDRCLCGRVRYASCIWGEVVHTVSRMAQSWRVSGGLKQSGWIGIVVQAEQEYSEQATLYGEANAKAWQVICASKRWGQTTSEATYQLLRGVWIDSTSQFFALPGLRTFGGRVSA